MATINGNRANDLNKPFLRENQNKPVTVYFGIFFDGTNNHRLQVMIGKLWREQKKKTEGKYVHENYLSKSEETLIKDFTIDEEKKEEIKRKIDALELRIEEKSHSSHDNDAIQVLFLLKEKEIYEKELLFLEKINENNKIDKNIKIPESYIHKKDDVQSESDFTNIAILEPHYQAKTTLDGNEYAYRIYVTGSGTNRDLSESADFKGLAFGQGPTGVIQKVKDAIDCVNRKLESSEFNGKNELEIHYDLFGFSRGATEARLFANILNKNNKETLINFKNKITTSIKNKDVLEIEQHIESSIAHAHKIKNDTLNKQQGLEKDIDSLIVELKNLKKSIQETDLEEKSQKLIQSIDTLMNKSELFIKKPKCTHYFDTLGIYDTVASVGVLNKGNMDTMKKAMNSINRLDIKDWYDGTCDFVINSAGIIGDWAFSKGSVSHSKNVLDLGLCNITHVENVLHICAADEYRENFALVSIAKDETQTHKGIEIFIPGCHADVGGGYPYKDGGYNVLLNDNYSMQAKVGDMSSMIYPIKEALEKFWGAKSKKNNQKTPYYF